jgi:hypothetical protein
MDRYDYLILMVDTNGNKYHFTAEQEPNEFDAAMLAEEWATQGDVNVAIDSTTILETDDPRVEL